MDDYEISTIRANYGEIAEEQMPELEAQFEALKAKFNTEKKEFDAKISALNTQFKDLVNLAKKGVKDYPLKMIDTFRIPVMGYYLYYSWVNDAFRLALVQEIPKHEYNDLFNSGEKNQEAFKELGYELPNVDFKDTRKNVRRFGEGEDVIEVWEEDGQDVWLEQWIEDFVDEGTSEVVPIERHEWHRVTIEEVHGGRRTKMTRLAHKKGRPTKYRKSLKNNPYWKRLNERLESVTGTSAKYVERLIIWRFITKSMTLQDIL